MDETGVRRTKIDELHTRIKMLLEIMANDAVQIEGMARVITELKTRNRSLEQRLMKRNKV